MTFYQHEWIAENELLEGKSKNSKSLVVFCKSTLRTCNKTVNKNSSLRLSQCDKNVCIIVSSDPDLVCSGTVMPYALYNTCVALCIVFKCISGTVMHYALYNTCVALCIVLKCVLRHCDALRTMQYVCCIVQSV